MELPARGNRGLGHCTSLGSSKVTFKKLINSVRKCVDPIIAKIRGATALAGGRLIAVFGELSEILVLDAATCEQTHTLLSRLEDS